MKQMTKRILVTIVALLLLSCIEKIQAQKDSTITISGQVTDFDGNPIDSCEVGLIYRDFNSGYDTYTDRKGFYKLEGVEKGQYVALGAMRSKDYPRENAVPEKDMRLEFWAWNVIADKDMTINPHYHRLELYGFQVFEVMGGAPYLMAYVRPMSLGKYLSYGKDVYLDKTKAEKMADISVQPDSIDFKIYADDEPLTIHSVLPLNEYEGEDNQPMRAFFLQFDRPKQFSGNYCIFRIEATHKMFGGEKGESMYFYEIKDYK